jgi:hypothetical protein
MTQQFNDKYSSLFGSHYVALTFSLSILKPVQRSGFGRKAAEPYRNWLSVTVTYISRY